ncbi:MAG: hypothetical protein Edafosvirus17_11 [Edafosvirus sp.]|uniref:Uncharacterized protein n=1 Tax=Edafosvirus sp. TaxID=2487765 RepID=A0A3G4ZUG8_9VIRU|nr:MAG: hypothetical protein Edafosvirus17_11 [Edafosvirus sp.]
MNKCGICHLETIEKNGCCFQNYCDICIIVHELTHPIDEYPIVKNLPTFEEDCAMCSKMFIINYTFNKHSCCGKRLCFQCMSLHTSMKSELKCCSSHGHIISCTKCHNGIHKQCGSWLDDDFICYICISKNSDLIKSEINDDSWIVV